MKINLYTQLLFSALVLLMLINGCSEPAEQEHEEEHHDEAGIIEFTQEQYKQAGIIIGKAAAKPVGQELEVNGIIDVPPHGNISINLPYGGFLKSTPILTGTMVKKGQFIASIQNPDFISFQQEYQDGLAQREFLEAEYKRDKILFNEEAISEREYQESKSLYSSNEIRINAQKERLKLIGFNTKEIARGKTTSIVAIYSPVSGSVQEVYTNVGKFMSPQDVIMDITDTRDLHIELNVFENDIPKIKNGQVIRFTVANSPDNIREAEIFLIGKNVRADRSVTVHGHLTSDAKDLLPGMYVSAKIVTSWHPALTVPEEAVVRFEGSNYIFSFAGKIEKNNQSIYQFNMVEVTKGMADRGVVQIDLLTKKEPLDSMDIVLEGAFHILSKSKNSGEGGHAH